MKIYFCEKCGVSIPLQQVVAGKATARDGKTYCSECMPEDPVSSDELKLYFCDNCGVSIPLQDVIHNRAKTLGEKMFCTDCGHLSEGQRAMRKDRVEQERKEKEESRYRLHFCDRCNTSIPQSHLVTGRALMRGGRTFCERCKTKTERRTVSAGAAVAFVLVLGILFVGGYVAFGGGAKLFANDKSEQEAAQREEDQRNQILAELKPALDRKDRELLDAATKIGDLEAKIDAYRNLLDKGARDDKDQDQVIGGILTDHAALKGEMGRRFEDAVSAALKNREALAALTARIAELERRPAAPPPPADEPERVEVPPAEPEGRRKPSPPPVEEAPLEVREWIGQLSDKDAGVRFSAAVELGRSGYAPAAEPLARVLEKDKDTFVRRAAARSLGELNVWSAVPVLIQTLEDREIFVAATASQALKSITGQDFGYKEDMKRNELRRVVQKAREWWTAHKDDR